MEIKWRGPIGYNMFFIWPEAKENLKELARFHSVAVRHDRCGSKGQFIAHALTIPTFISSQ